MIGDKCPQIFPAPRSHGAVVRGIVLGTAALWLLLLWPRPAEAHGGVTALRTDSGPYRVIATVTRTDDVIDETIVVLERGKPAPTTRVQVAVTVTAADGTARGPFVARRIADSFEARYPPPRSGRGTQVLVSVRGPLGDIDVSHAYKAPGRELAVGSGLGGFVLFALGGALPVGVMLYLVLRPGSRVSTPPATHRPAAGGA